MEVIYTLKNIVLWISASLKWQYRVRTYNRSWQSWMEVITPVQFGCSKKVASLAVYPLRITA
nr:MAG TPA: hypothetical protein [Caudoviricetes sp.]